MKKELVAASSIPIVLAILARGESYGYAIIQEVRERSNGQLHWTDGMLYPVLHRIERRGLARSQWQTSETGRRRKYYRLTRAGRRELDETRRQWTAVHSTLNQLWEAGACLISTRPSKAGA